MDGHTEPHDEDNDECNCPKCCGEYVGHEWVYENDDGHGGPWLYICNHCGATAIESEVVE